MKLIGVLLVLSGSFGAGFAAVRRLDCRVAALRALTTALDVLAHELEISLPAMSDWLLDTASRSPEPAASFLRACTERLEQQGGAALWEAWSDAAQQELSMLKTGDMEVLLSLGTVLGRYDGESQRRSITAVHAQLTVQLESALEERRRCGRIYGTLSAVLGIFLVIILI